MASELITLQDTERAGNLNPVQAQRLAELRKAGTEGHPEGIHQYPGAPTSFYDSGAGYVGGTAPAGGIGFNQPQTLDLAGLYQKLYDTSSIKNDQTRFEDLSKKASERELAKNEALAKINDNPFYSEGTRVGRAAKLNEIYNNDVTALTGQQKVIQDKIATQKADIETKLNIQTKQFDINSQAATQALNQFNSLLSAGALDSASGTDIANLTRSTGIPSSMIQSAIAASRKAKEKDIQTQTISFDDGNNTGFAVINSQTGEIIKKQVVAASAPTATEQKAAAGGSSGGSKASSTSKTVIINQAKAGFKNVDTNKDKLISLQEFQRVVNNLMSVYGIGQSDAASYAAQGMSALGYSKWKW